MLTSLFLLGALDTLKILLCQVGLILDRGRNIFSSFCVYFLRNLINLALYQVSLSSPVLNEGELESLLKDPILKPTILPTFFNIRKGVDGSLEKTLYKLCEAADEAVRNGSQLLVLSDRSDELVSTFWNL